MGNSNVDLRLLVEVREKIIREYFSMWVTKDFSRLTKIFSSNCVFQESYGPCYLSLVEMNQWIEQKLNEQNVLSWKIKEVWPSIDETFFVIWNFTAIEKTTINFDGVSVIHFDKTGLIDSIKNYRSKSEHCFPYHI